MSARSKSDSSREGGSGSAGGSARPGGCSRSPLCGVLALDLGTRTGYACAEIDALGKPGPIQCGTWLLATEHELKARGPLGARNWDPRVSSLHSHVWSVLEGFQRSGRVLVAWEDVQFIVSRDQAHLWAGLRAAVWVAIAEWDYAGGQSTRISINTGALKRFATGDGSADKALMRHWGEQRGIVRPDDGLDDNAVDARWVLEFALSYK